MSEINESTSLVKSAYSNPDNQIAMTQERLRKKKQAMSSRKPPLSRHHMSQSSFHASEIHIGQRGGSILRAKNQLKTTEEEAKNSDQSMNMANNADLSVLREPVSLDPKDIVLETNMIDLDLLKIDSSFKEFKYKEAIYLGQMNDHNERHGLGVMKYANGRQFEGNWRNNVRNGRGFERYHNGNTYFGSFKDGKAHGKGVYTWQNGEVYDGEWDQGLKHGYGIWKGSQNDSYIGEWNKSRAHGYGVHTWPNGDKYEGEWHFCLKQGTGTETFANGDSYTG